MKDRLTSHVRRRHHAPAWVVTMVALLCFGGAMAQDGGSRATSLSLSADARTSYTMDSRRGGIDGGDFVVDLRPGLQLSSRSGRVVGTLSYSLGFSQHSRSYGGASVQNTLNAAGTAELVPGWAYMEASANISQQIASASGSQSVSDSTGYNPNRIEVGSVNFSPYVRGSVAGAVTYEARLVAAATNGRRSITADSTSTGGSLSVGSTASGTALSWNLAASSSTLDYRAGRATTSERVTASLQYIPDVDWTLTVRGGQETTDVIDVQRKSTNNWGLGFTWRPDPRTRLQADADDRYFGRSYRVLLDHRLTSSSIQFSSSRDAVNGADPNGGGSRATLYDIYFFLFASSFPDPVERDRVVRDFLLSQGLDPNASVSLGSINPSVTLQQSHQMTLSYAGKRITGTLQVFGTRTRAIDASATADAREGTSQLSYVANASYRLSPTENVSLTGSRLLTRATSSRSSSELKSLSLSYGNQFGRRTSFSLGARYSVFNSASDPYREAAISASLSQRF